MRTPKFLLTAIFSTIIVVGLLFFFIVRSIYIQTKTDTVQNTNTQGQDTKNVLKQEIPRWTELREPTFQDFPTTLFTGTPAAFDIALAQKDFYYLAKNLPYLAQKYRGVNQEDAWSFDDWTVYNDMIKATKPDFAGHYIVEGAGCGTSCLSLSILDIKTGKLFHFFSSNGSEPTYKVNSYMVFDPVPSFDFRTADMARAFQQFYVWNESATRLEPIYQRDCSVKGKAFVCGDLKFGCVKYGQDEGGIMIECSDSQDEHIFSIRDEKEINLFEQNFFRLNYTNY